MSAWTSFRDAVEALFRPTVEGAVALVHTIEADVIAESKGDLAKAFRDAVTVYLATPGVFADKLVAALSAFAVELIGDVIAIVKKDTAAAEATPPQV